jgi:U3 small nucleolar RNA-associated protein 19
MRLVKEEAEHLAPPGGECYFPHALFRRIIGALVYAEKLDDNVRDEFVHKYLEEYDDVRYSFLVAITCAHSL